jgi:hypothetical protein
MKLTVTQKKQTERWTRSKADQMAVANGCWFDLEAAKHACDFLATFAREGGEPLTLLKWQSEEVIKPLFGWKRPDGRRRYDTGYVEAPEHGALAALVSWLELYRRAEGDTQPMRIITAAPCLATRKLYNAERGRAASIQEGTIQDDTHFAYVRLETLEARR